MAYLTRKDPVKEENQARLKQASNPENGVNFHYKASESLYQKATPAFKGFLDRLYN